MAEDTPTIPTTTTTPATPPDAPVTAPAGTTTEAPEWTKDPLYASVVAKVPAKFIRATPAETLAAQAESYAELEKFKSKPATPPEPKEDEPKKDDAAPLAIEPPKTPETDRKSVV